MKPLLKICTTLAVLGFNMPVTAARPDAEAVHEQSTATAADAKYSFIVFYKANNAATQAMLNTVKRALTGQKEMATVEFADINDPTHQEFVTKYSLGRAPMPLTLVIAPNGAVTAAFPQKVSAEGLASAFVSPATMHCMKASQEGSVVLVHVHMSDRPTLPSGVREFCADKLFKDRVSVISLRADDETEKSFLAGIEVDGSLREPMTAMIAPPGAFLGKFTSSATKDEMAAALHKAGQCCEDENCKHNKKSQAAKQTGARRN